METFANSTGRVALSVYHAAPSRRGFLKPLDELFQAMYDVLASNRI